MPIVFVLIIFCSNFILRIHIIDNNFNSISLLSVVYEYFRGNIVFKKLQEFFLDFYIFYSYGKNDTIYQKFWLQV